MTHPPPQAPAHRRRVSRDSQWRGGAIGDGQDVGCPTPVTLTLVRGKQGTSGPVLCAWRCPVAAAVAHWAAWAAAARSLSW
jgi:hypothetical protein